MARPRTVGHSAASLCGLTLAVLVACSASPTPSPSGSAQDAFDLASFGWWVEDPRFEGDGLGAGYGLRVGLLDDVEGRGGEFVDLAPWAVELPGARGPVIVGPAGGRIAYLADDGLETQLRVADVTGEVGRARASFPDIVWTLAIDPHGRAAYAVLLGRARGEDHGVWRVPLIGERPPDRVLPPSTRGVATRADGGMRLAAVSRFVRELQVSLDGRFLVRRACGEPFGSCDLDVVSLEDGTVQRFAETDVTDLLGMVEGRVIGGWDEECTAAGACRGIRTALDTRTGLMIPIAPSDGRDRIAIGDAGQGLHVFMEDTGGQPMRSLLRVTDLRTGIRWAATEPLAGLWYQPPSLGVVGVELPPGWILVSVDVATAVHLQSGTMLPLNLPEPQAAGAFNG